MVIPLSKPYVGKDIKEAISRVLDSGQFILGEQCREFEGEFSAFVGSKHAILTSSGTSAIFLCLKALEIGPGDGVIVTPLTAFPTIEPILHVGARPIFVDVNYDYLMDIKQVEFILENHRSFSVKIKVIIPVHIYGTPANMDPIMDVANKHGLHVLEDCCQAHGAIYKGKRVGSIGVAGCFSFYPSKNLSVLGDGGIITTSNDKLSELCKMYRDHGRKGKYEHDLVGYNMRFNEIQAVIGRIQLRKLDEFNQQRVEIASWYNKFLENVPIITPKVEENIQSVYHLYVIRAISRDGLAEHLRKNGIQTGIHYPIPCHKQQAVKGSMDFYRKLKNVEKIVTEILSLPMYPGLMKEEVVYICENIRDYYRQEIGDKEEWQNPTSA